jgi:hypothetical protein
MLILPTSDPIKAKTLLSQLAADRKHCVLIVFGDGERPQEIASRADVRADGNPFRQVVLVPKPSVLEGDPQYAPLLRCQGAGAEVVAMTTDFQISSVLSGDDATDFFALEQAFASAQMGKVLAS